MTDSIQPLLERLDACSEAREWAGQRTLAEVWTECARGDWLLWLAQRLRIDRSVIVRAAVECVRPALVYLPAREWPARALEVMLAWCEGKATIEEVRQAGTVAARAATESDSGAGAWAAWSVADSAWSVVHEEWAFAWASAAGASYAARMGNHGAEAAGASSLLASAETVRRLIPLATIEAAAGAFK